MKTKTEYLKKAFLNLDDKHLGNLKFHLENKTPIACGEQGRLYVSDEGHG